MSRPTRRSTSPIYNFFPIEVEGSEALVELALDMRWSWNHAADAIWDRLEHELWQQTQNPWVVLQTASEEKLRRELGDPGFRRLLDEIIEARRQASESATWFQQEHAGKSLSCIAYFCMEFMLSEALPIYSGGLGNVAGDYLKTASDLGVPAVGVGLLYQQGYFRQMITRSGNQQALFPYNDPGQLPIIPLREENGEWLRLVLKFPGYPIWLRAWQAQVGRSKLYLLDSNDPANFPALRGITSELYGGGPELRLMQEMVLGIGGWRLLGRLGLKPDVCHLNEGHAAFAVLEHAHSFMLETGTKSFATALAVTRAGNLFTTHTPVDAGFDRFSPALIRKYFGTYASERLGIPVEELLAFGRKDPENPLEDFNMAYLAVRGSGAVNGVSRLHGAVSRRIFQPLFPRWPQAEVPVGHITNGVHMSSWDSPEADELWTQSCGKERWLGPLESLKEKVRALPDPVIWECRASVRNSFVEFVRGRLSLQLVAAGAPAQEVQEAKNVFDANTLTLGFARRFATYKRPDLLLHNPDRLLRILSNPARPVQLIIAGKAHPEDEPGKTMIRRWIEFIQSGPDVRKHVVFLSDYDIFLTQEFVHGVDVWLNTPRRPWEACGTSGMKVLVNGGLNLSELDGWWAEAYSPEVGWALGDGMEHDADPAWDAAEAEKLYGLLESNVAPEFYTRDERGIPVSWVSRIRESMAGLTPIFSSTRMVSEYIRQYYIPAASEYRRRAAGGGAEGEKITAWLASLECKWANLRFGEVRVEKPNGSEKHRFTVQVYLNGISPEEVKVELYAEGAQEAGPFRQEMVRGEKLIGAENGYIYSAEAPTSRPASDYTPRIIPYRPGVAVPLESGRILWQR
jgi:starch phosphorylase